MVPGPAAVLRTAPGAGRILAACEPQSSRRTMVVWIGRHIGRDDGVEGRMPRYSLVRARYREARALELFSAGKGWPEISDELGYSDRSGAHKAAMRALRRRAVAAVDVHRDEVLRRSHVMLEGAWSKALAGDLHAAAVALRAMELQDRTLGLSRCDRPHVPAPQARRQKVSGGPPGQGRIETAAQTGVFADLGV